MTTLIAILIALLGFGTPSDFEDYTEDELQIEIDAAEASADANNDGGNGSAWDYPDVQ